MGPVPLVGGVAGRRSVMLKALPNWRPGETVDRCNVGISGSSLWPGGAGDRYVRTEILLNGDIGDLL